MKINRKYTSVERDYNIWDTVDLIGKQYLFIDVYYFRLD